MPLAPYKLALRLWGPSIAFCSLTLSPCAWAFHYTFDGMFGLSYAQKGGSYIKGSIEPPMGSALGFPFGVTGLIGVNNPSATLTFFLGASYRIASYPKSSHSYTYQALYPLLRVNVFRRFYIQAGASPLIYQRVAADFGISGFSRGGSPLGIYTEGGFEIPISPEIAFVPAVALTRIMNVGGTAPTIADALIGFRLFYGTWKWEGGGGSKYDGYRYPFGREKPR